MHEHFRQELARIGAVAVGVALLGWISGAWALALLTGLGGYLLWQLRQLWLFEEWLLGAKRNRTRLRGIWSEAADRIRRTRRRARQRKKRLSQALPRLEQLQVVRRDFIANVSHELRTPLTVVKGYLEMLAEDPLPEEAREAVRASLRQAQRMERLVEDLLMLSRLELEEKPPVNEEVAVATLLRGLAADAAKLCEHHGDHPLDLHLDESLALRGSESELASAFGNLLFNAVLHTPPGTPIELRWERTAQGARLVVADRGPGIAPEHLERLTERFYRVDKSRSRERGGTGLGLSIVRHVLLRHQATLKIDSAPGEGSRFLCLFPQERVVTL
jgi:two-component system phosphate regulon sensor histidine kinase PhoR